MVRERRRAERLGFREGNGSVKGQKMAYSWFKISFTSRRAGSRPDVRATSRRDRGQTSPRRDVTEDKQAHVAT